MLATFTLNFDDLSEAGKEHLDEKIVYIFWGISRHFSEMQKLKYELKYIQI